MDFLSDMITRLKNSQRVDKTSVVVKYSKTNLRLSQILQNEGFISHYTLKSFRKKDTETDNYIERTNGIEIFLKTSYPTNQKSIKVHNRKFSISRVSKRTRRV